MRSRIFVAVGILAALSGCALYNSVKTGKPLDPVQVQQDMQNANYLLRAAGCAVVQQASVAAPVVTINANSEGQQVLQAVDAAGRVACEMVVPPTALPIPVTPSTPLVSAPAATATSSQ